MKFSEKDINQIEAHGLSISEIDKQIEKFEKGMKYANIKAAATIGNGILQLSEDEIAAYTSYFDSEKANVSIVKFVPASGAASRMFKFLFQFLRGYDPKKQSLNAYINKNALKDLPLFLIGLEKFPFFNIVIKHLESTGINYNELDVNERAFAFVKAMLEDTQLNFGNYPKGLVPFHKYNKNISTAFEEHLFEMAFYGSQKKPLQLHFTVSKKHKKKFSKEFERIEKRVELKTGFEYDITYSYQDKATDTIALTPKNDLFRLSNSKLFFRPSGHGSLLKNLNAIDADVIFISNIDNVVVKDYKSDVAYHKKVLAGMLLKVKSQVFDYIKLLKTQDFDEAKITEIYNFILETLNYDISKEFKKYSKKYKIETLLDALNRPLRVCGMVKNEGEPGGGPFWVKDESGKLSLQIVESAQVNQKNREQRQIMANATHFNPVDIVCCIKDHEGNTFDLQKYVNHDAGFITTKTYLGEKLKTLELPGLWNGSMAHWNTIFIEVSILTFNPVKTVNDLLKISHQLY